MTSSKDCLFIIDPLESLHLETDTSLLLMGEAQRRGIGVYIAELRHLEFVSGNPSAFAFPVQVPEGLSCLPQPLEPKHRALDSFEWIFMRKDPPVDTAYRSALYLLDHVSPRRRVINSASAILHFHEKISALRWHHLMPPTLVSSQRDSLLSFAKEYRDIILKPLHGFGGMGVFHFSHQDTNLRSAVDWMTQEGKEAVMMQGYVDMVRKGDIRVFLVAGEVLGAVRRVPRKDDVRGNFHAGGRAEKTCLTEAERKVCEELSGFLIKESIFFAGVDLIGGFLTEVNITSPTCICEANKVEGSRLETMIFEKLACWKG